jgi:hypothetical protein
VITEDMDDPSGWMAPFVEVFADLKVSLGKLADELKARRRLEQQWMANQPNYYSFGKMSQPGVATTDIQDFGGPMPGREWIVRIIGAVASPLAANAAVVTWYVGQNMPGPAAGMLPGNYARAQFASVPAFNTYSSNILKVNSNENLLVGLTGIPASSAIHLVACVDDQPVGSGTPVTLM